MLISLYVQYSLLTAPREYSDILVLVDTYQFTTLAEIAADINPI